MSSQQRITVLRKQRGWSQEKLAAISGLGARTIQRIEKEGKASLESTLALASAFEVTPQQLALKDTEVETISDSTTPSRQQSSIYSSVRWFSVLSMVFIIAVASLVIQMTAKYPGWEKISASLVIFIPLLFSVLTFGLGHTKSLLLASRYVFKATNVNDNLSTLIYHCQSFINSVYAVGFISSIVCAIVITKDQLPDTNYLTWYLQYFTRPLFYALLVAELWFRPLKRRLEFLLQTGLEKSQ